MLKCGAPTTLPPTLPHISLTSPFPTSPPHPNTLSYTFSYTSSHISPSSPTPQHIFLPSPHISFSLHVLNCLVYLPHTQCTPYTASLSLFGEIERPLRIRRLRSFYAPVHKGLWLYTKAQYITLLPDHLRKFCSSTNQNFSTTKY